MKPNRKTNKQKITACNSSNILEKSFVKIPSHVTLQKFESAFMQETVRVCLCALDTWS